MSHHILCYLLPDDIDDVTDRGPGAQGADTDGADIRVQGADHVSTGREQDEGSSVWRFARILHSYTWKIAVEPKQVLCSGKAFIFSVKY